MWRVGVSQSHVMIIDIDSKDIENAKDSKLFMKTSYNADLPLSNRIKVIG